MKKIVFPILILIGVIIGFFIGYYFKPFRNVAITENTERSEKIVKNPNADAPSKILTGIVQSKGPSTLTIKVPLLSDQIELETRLVTIDEKTEIIAYTKKTKEQLTSEIGDFIKANGSHLTEEEYVNSKPAEYTEKSITVDGISVGEAVRVEADENIAQKRSFTATKIIISK